MHAVDCGKHVHCFSSPRPEDSGHYFGVETTICCYRLVRLLIDYAIVKKKKLYIVYDDFSKAYDRVPRGKLVHLLAAMGCGAVMLAAVASMYNVSYGIIGITVITCTIGVRQGSPTSCFVFTMNVNPLLRKLKSQCQC